MSVIDQQSACAESAIQHLETIDIDLRCALAFSRALMRGLATVSPQAQHALDGALREELEVIGMDDCKSSAAAYSIISEARASLKALSSLKDRLAIDLERAIVEKANSLEPGRLVVEKVIEETRRLRSCG